MKVKGVVKRVIIKQGGSYCSAKDELLIDDDIKINNQKKLTHVSLFVSGSTNIKWVAVKYNVPTIGFLVL